MYQALSSRLNEPHTPPTSTTLKEYLVDFLATYSSPSTRRTYKQSLDAFIEWVGSSKTPDDVEPLDLIRYGQRLENSPIAPATVEKHKKAIKRFFNWLHKDARVTVNNPGTAMKQHRVTRKIRRDKAMTDEELKRLLEFFKYQPRNNAICRFLADTGCRASGVATLTLDRLNLDELFAEVSEKHDRASQQYRKVMFSESTANVIRQWLLQRPSSDHQFVFTWGINTLNAQAISQVIRRGCYKVGNRSLGSHSLRHRIGHMLADNGVPPTIAQVILGHSNVETTLNAYYPDDWSRVAATMRQIVYLTNQLPGDFSEDPTAVHQNIINLFKTG